MGMKYEEIDKARLAQLIREARAKNDFSSGELGDIVAYLCRIMLTASNYHRYTEDWQLEMLGQAAFVAFKAMATTAELDNDVRLFNYIYTAIDNSFKKTLKKLNGELVPDNSEDAKPDANGLRPFYLRNKSRIVKGCLRRNGRDVVSVASHMKVRLLEDVLNKTARIFSNTLKIDEIDKLIAMARSTREALC